MGLAHYKSTVTRVGCEHAVIPDEMRPGSRYQGRQTGDEVVWFEQYVRRSISERAFQLEHHQAIPIDNQALLGDRWTSHVSA